MLYTHTASLAPLLRSYLMSKKGDWDRPGKESITPAEGREPERDVVMTSQHIEDKFLYCTYLLCTYLKEGFSVAEGHD